MTTTSRSDVAWRYIPSGRVKHALHIRGTLIGHDSVALCGSAPVWYAGAGGDWHGTGSQVEYEEVDARPECKSCRKLLGPVLP